MNDEAPAVPLHNDLIASHMRTKEQVQKKIQQTYKETQHVKFSRLESEYELTLDYVHSEWYLQNILINDVHDNDTEKWFNYAKFCLQYGMTNKATLFMNKYIEVQGIDERLNIIMGAMNIQNENYNKALSYFHTILEQQWDHIKANLLMGLVYQFTNRPGL